MTGASGDRRRRGARAIALPGARPIDADGLRALFGGARAWLLERLADEAEAGRPALWTPVAFGIGVIVYFTAENEPELWAALALAVAGVAAVVLARRRFVGLGLAIGLAAAASGFLAGKLATLRADAPVLARAQSAEVVGRVLSVEPRDRGARRVTLQVESFGKMSASERPGRVRVTMGKEPTLAAGDRASLSAFWRPPQGPVRPGGYDFARVAYFDGVGATGAQPKAVKNLGPALDLSTAARAGVWLERLRESLTARISGAIGGPEGAVAAALVTGVRGPIPQDVEDDLRAAGLFHILSISGLHMALVAGTLFWLVRAVLALSQTAALRWPTKAIAAVVALAGTTFYLALSGADVATQRSYLMVAIVFAAILVGRPAVTLRNLALAALAVMAIKPDAVLGPSFQMSFAAVAGLVAFFETRRGQRVKPEAATRWERALDWIGTVVYLALMTTLVAGLATAPFAAYHFHRVTPYALAGNALAEPLIALIVMPSVVGGLLLAPLGLDGLFWAPMGWGLELVLKIARMVASWPGSERNVGAFGEGALVLFALGLAWLCLWRTALRWAGVAMLGLALALAAMPERPDVVIDPSGRTIAVRGPDGVLALTGARPSSFAAKVWIAADGAEDIRAAKDKGAKAAKPVTAVRCDGYGCIAPLAGGGEVALIWDARAFDEDCRRSALVVTRLQAPEACADTAAVVDRRSLDATGALSLTRDGDAFQAVAARDPSGARPWAPRRGDAPPDEALKLTFAPRQPAPPVLETARPVDPTEDREAAPDTPSDDE